MAMWICQISLVVSLLGIFDDTIPLALGREMVRSISSFELNWIRFNIYDG